jgi:hypothetical protein
MRSKRVFAVNLPIARLHHESFAVARIDNRWTGARKDAAA